jgi:hypothetical protein
MNFATVSPAGWYKPESVARIDWGAITAIYNTGGFERTRRAFFAITSVDPGQAQVMRDDQMNKTTSCSAYVRLLLAGLSISGLAFVSLLAGAPGIASAQNAGNFDPAQSTNWAAGAIAHAQEMRRFKDADHGPQTTPPIIPKLEFDEDPAAKLEPFSPAVPRLQQIMRSFKIWEPMDAPVLPIISHRPVGPSAPQAFARGSIPARERIRSFGWSMVPPVRPMMWPR